jgi:ATP-dependent helicase HrpB
LLSASSAPLPVDAVLPELMTALDTHPRAILCAAPGAGKTTRVPLALLTAGWTAGRRILVLVPRRMAARSAAGYMAAQLGEKVGATVGYQIRMERRIGPQTRIEVLTEGVLTRRLQRDPELGAVACVIFDEFHERHLQADLALALCLDLQGVLNPDLRLLVMSATLAVDPLRKLLAEPPVVTSDVQQHPVETRHHPLAPQSDLAAGVAGAIRRALDDHPGSVLAFLPGAREIRSVERRLRRVGMSAEVDLYPLYGQLPQKVQNAALAPVPEGRRKVVLATNIAETSLTIEGVGVVVDGGYCRTPRLDLASGMSRLVTRRISRASARQRRGRAGRTGPGVCLRLWDRGVHAGLLPFDPPEIQVADLAPLALELAAWGSGDPGQLCWLDPPPAEALEQARGLLHSLGALDGEGRITAHGRRMVGLPLHPRLAHMVLEARECGLGRLACRLAALLDAGDPLRFDTGQYSADLHQRLVVVLDGQTAGTSADGRVDRPALARIRKVSGDLERQLDLHPQPDHGAEALDLPPATTTGRLLAWAYPERVALARSGKRGHFQLVNGRGAWLDPGDPLAGEEMLVAAHLDGQRREARIFLGAPYDRHALETQFVDKIETQRSVTWDAGRRRVQASTRLCLGALVLARRPWSSPPADRVQTVLVEGLRQAGLEALPWTKALRHWVQRADFAANWWTGEDPWPGFDAHTLAAELDLWLGPFLQGCRAVKDITGGQLHQALAARLSWAQQKALDRLAPTQVRVPSGSRLVVDYGNDPPILKVRIQEMFGATQTPTVADGRQPLLLHLLSPAQRPMQVTQDLAQFWAVAYPQIKKELHGRYPRHHWPDDPLTAIPTRHAKRRKSRNR